MPTSLPGQQNSPRRTLVRVVFLALTAALLLMAVTAQQRRRQTLNRHLIDSIQRSDVAAVQRLLREGADPDASNYEEDQDARSAFERSKRLLNLWWHHKPSGRSALILALLPSSGTGGGFSHEYTQQQCATAELLLKYGAAVNYEDQDGETPLGLAAACGSLRAVRLLISYRADVNSGMPLLRASMTGDDSVVEALIAHGANIDAKDGGGYSALMFSTGSGRLSTLKTLLRHGASVDLANENGYTALMIAVQQWDPEKVAVLVEAGANVNLRNFGGESALSIAQQGTTWKSYAEIMRALTPGKRPQPRSAPP